MEYGDILWFILFTHIYFILFYRIPLLLILVVDIIGE